jgi:hypothetical protein
MYGAEGGRGHKKEETLSAGMHQGFDQNRAVDEAAKLIGVSPRYIQEAKAIAKEAPEKIKEIQEGCRVSRPPYAADRDFDI